MRILWISDSPDTPSGFGTVTASVCQGLAARGHDVSIMGWQTKLAGEWNGCRVYPSLGKLASETIFPFLVRQRPEIVIALADVWWLPYFCSPHVRRQMELTDTPWVLYFPIDGDMEGEALPASWVDLLRQVDVPVAMSQYGKRIAERHGIGCRYIPHGVDLDVFCPPADRQGAKADIGAEGKFLVLSDSRNQPRKMLPRLLDIFARFAAACPESVLHLHTDPDDEFTRSGIYSYNVRSDVRHLGIESKVRFTPGMTMKGGGGISLATLARYYQAADLHLLASSGEGFGLPTLQAAAAGAIPMASAYTASLELTEGHGEPVGVSDWTANEFGIRRGLIDVKDAVLRLKRLYENQADLPRRSARCREFALRYGWNTVVDQWHELISSIARSPQRILKSPAARTEPFQKLLPGSLPNIPGVSVSVRVVERQLGRTEASILADARQPSDVRLPALPKSCEVGGVRVPRTIGHVGMAGGGVPVFLELKRIFPILSGWVVAASAEDLREGEEKAWTASDLRLRRFECPEEARFDLAQSVLLLNIDGALPAQLLIDAACYGVPCIGSAIAAEQSNLWPDLATTESAEAARLARGLLTDAARLQRVSDQARNACLRLYTPDEEDSAFWLRQLHAKQLTQAAMGMAG
jgi:glycosyltransferase involved in cell wall biosynthesis